MQRRNPRLRELSAQAKQEAEAAIRKAEQAAQLEVNENLRQMYQRKAYNVGLSLQTYCERFGVKQVWSNKNAGART